MDYLTVDFMVVRSLVLQHEMEPDLQPRLDDPVVFRASNEINRAKLVICGLRERSMKVNQILFAAPHSGQPPLRKFEDERSIWFDDSFLAELLCLIPIAVARCPDLLFPEILVHAVLTTKNPGPVLEACFVSTPMLKRQCIELLVGFIYKWMQVTNAGTHYKPSDPFLLHCLQRINCTMEFFCRINSHTAFTLREALLQRCVYPNMIFQITVEGLKDVVDFMGRALFSNEETCQWMLSCIRFRNKGTEPCSSSAERIMFSKVSDPGPLFHPNFLQFKEGTVLLLCQALHNGAKAALHEHGWSTYLCCHLKLYCVLVNLGGVQPTDEEVAFWLGALIHTIEGTGDNERSPICKNLISKQRFQLGIAFLFLVSSLRRSSLIDILFQKCILIFLETATSNIVHFERGSEIALWLVVQLLSQSYAQVSEFCCKAVGMKIKIASACWEDVCRIAYETRITSDIDRIVKAASALKPVGPISSTMADQWAVECLFQLLKLGHFTRYEVDITESIKSCIVLSVEPIHPVVVQMIEIFAKASSTPTSMDCSDVYKMPPLPYSFLVSVIKPFSPYSCVLESALKDETEEMPTSHESRAGGSSLSNCTETDLAAHAVLASYYVLCRENFQRDQGFNGNCQNSLNCTSGKQISWSIFLRSLPWSKLLAYLESRQHLYENVYAQWVGLAMAISPERLPASYLIQRLEPEKEFLAKVGAFPEFEKRPELGEQIGVHRQKLKLLGQNNENEEEMGVFSIELAHQVLKNSLVDCFPALKLLKTFHAHKVPAKVTLGLQMVIVEDLIPLLLDVRCSVPLQEAFCEWWYSLDSVTVELLTPVFCRCISCLDGDVDNKGSSFTNEIELLSVSELYQELVEQPFSILSCRTEVYQTPLVSVFLDILRELLLRNRQTCLMASKNDGAMKKEVLRAVDMRDSAVCQILLENWSKMISVDFEEDLVRKAGSSICAFISSLFYSSPSIFRIVHFQGYDMKLIPTIVEGVNLMVHFLEYFEDSLHVVALSMLPFMVVLLSNVIRRYPYHSRSLSAAQKAVMHIKSMTLETVIDSLGEVLEPVSWLAVTFSMLEPEVREFLGECARAVNLDEMPAKPHVEKFHSSLLSALSLLNKDHMDGGD